jgi:hypothetical protein
MICWKIKTIGLWPVIKHFLDIISPENKIRYKEIIERA